MSIKKMILVGVGVCLVRSTIKDILDTIRLKAYYGSPIPRPVPPGFRMDNPVKYNTSYSQMTNSNIYKNTSKSDLRMPKTDEAIARAINGRFNDPPKDFKPPFRHFSEICNETRPLNDVYRDDLSAPSSENISSAQETPAETEEGDS